MVEFIWFLPTCDMCLWKYFVPILVNFFNFFPPLNCVIIDLVIMEFVFVLNIEKQKKIMMLACVTVIVIVLGSIAANKLGLLQG